MNGTISPPSSFENPVTVIRKRNRKIQRLILAVGCALVAASILLIAPEIGATTALLGSLVAGGSSAAFTIAAKHTHL
jgi:hypothetical protein